MADEDLVIFSVAGKKVWALVGYFFAGCYIHYPLFVWQFIVSFYNDLWCVFLSLKGDPTVFGNLNPPKEALNAVVEATLSGKHNGYIPAVGMCSICVIP